MSKRVLIVTGLSGAGRTSALKILEDFGFEAIDNIPFFFLKNIIEVKTKKNLALGIDIRSRDFDAKKIVSLIKKKKKGIDISVVFFDCDNQKLINRYDESRRLHPLKLDLPMEDVIDRERHWLEPLKKISQYYLDTTDLTVRIISFGYKNGLPREADFVFDMRFLKNPFYVKKLKKLDGRNPEIIKFVKNQGLFLFFFDSMDTLINKILNGFNEEGKDYITIAFGCTGGVHRSVVSSEYFHSFLQKNKEIEVFIDHRDLKI
jgi:UPF0042 nucleotide-binding protein